MHLSLSSNNISTLAKMSFIVERDIGKRFKLSQPESVLSLLQHAAQSSNDELDTLFRDFVGSLDSSVQEQLVYRGVAIPQELRNAAAQESADSAQVVKKSRRVYRGQVIEGDETATQKTATSTNSPTSANNGTTRRSKRIYRGQVIED